MTTTALILASGRGSRMSSLCESLHLPKHLLPLPTGETIIGRLLSSLAPHCDELLVTVRSEEDLGKFKASLSPLCPRLKIIVRDSSEVEFSELIQVSKLITTDNVVQTNGDLIFAEGVVESFVKKNRYRKHFYRGREGNPENMESAFDIFNSRISILPANKLKQLAYASSAYVLKEMFLSLLLGRVEKVPTLFNVDTPEIYEAAKQFFSKDMK